MHQIANPSGQSPSMQHSAPQLPFDVISIDHIRFNVGNAKQTAYFYAQAFGMTPVARRLPDGRRGEHADYLMESGSVRFLFTGGVAPGASATTWAAAHGDSVSDIALEVTDVDDAYRHALACGATGLVPPHDNTDEGGTVRAASIGTYGELRHSLVDRSRYRGAFLPGFVPLPASDGRPSPLFQEIDHVVGCVELGKMDDWIEYYHHVLGFTNMAEFVGGAIATDYSSLMSKVAADGSRRIKFPINEPAVGKRRSQVDEYIEYHAGPGVQHIALLTEDILAATDFLRAAGIEFLQTPDSYYDDPQLRARIGEVRVPVEELKTRRILVDRDEEGYLLQIFTRPLLDRPTFFVELIERNGSQGFGKGNFKALFEAVEREQERRGNL